MRLCTARLPAVLAVAPQDEDAQLAKVAALMQLGNWEQAHAAIAKSPLAPKLRFELVRALARRGQQHKQDAVPPPTAALRIARVHPVMATRCIAAHTRPAGVLLVQAGQGRRGALTARVERNSAPGAGRLQPGTPNLHRRRVAHVVPSL